MARLSCAPRYTLSPSILPSRGSAAAAAAEIAGCAPLLVSVLRKPQLMFAFFTASEERDCRK